MKLNDTTIVLRGGGDLATGVTYALFKAGFKVLIAETDRPSAIRRSVAFCDAVYEEKQTVEGITCKKAKNFDEAMKLLEKERIALLVDPDFSIIKSSMKPQILVDAVIAKRNIGTTKDMADFVVAMGPGFVAQKDCDVVIETNRGHNMGRIIYEGSAEPNTGVPGIIAGFGKERVIHSPAEGKVKLVHNIGDTVSRGELIANICDKEGNIHPVYASLDGVLRGIIREDFEVFEGMKMADIDPRIAEKDNCFTISDKSRALGNAVLLAVMEHIYKNFCD